MSKYLPDKFEHYRKASKTDIKCQNCKLSFLVWYRKGLRCGDFGYNQHVGKNMTCDAAKSKEESGIKAKGDKQNEIL